MLARFRLVSLVVTLAVVACSGANVGTPSRDTPALSDGIHSGGRSVRYSQLHSFGGVGDGNGPAGALIAVNGTLYGTTTFGGGALCIAATKAPCGTVYSITPAGAERVAYSFGNQTNDGSYPYGNLIEANGTLYGTTADSAGGVCSSSTCGTVYQVGAPYVASTLVTFSTSTNANVGFQPVAGLVSAGSKLYGTTAAGGVYKAGTVWSVTTAGTSFTILYAFGASQNDGTRPTTPLTLLGSELYGVTAYGGRYGRGTIFRISTGTGTPAILYSFGQQAHDGAQPAAPLINVNGTLYGTTSRGGRYGKGTVFSYAISHGTLVTLHSFGKGQDGDTPLGRLLPFQRRLYGTTSNGGGAGTGTVFSIRKDGMDERVVYSFGGGTDGANPQAGLVAIGNTLYGTTLNGGPIGKGTVFAIQP